MGRAKRVPHERKVRHVTTENEMAKKEEITILIKVKPGMSMWDAIKMRIAGGTEIFWNALAKKITDDEKKQ